ncbi:nucleotidyl transferase AbiEii/AbiGii toxin family protein [Arachidicoccus sp.]|uniref:nucleotidyl transferase AbiEii/AbiGii toxin family protein n=1 Tax=Arachidicoccus sp. TaxID=1872624 RepID=UPI003D1AEEAC
MKIAVSQILREVIIELMDEPALSDFYLGGGTNLAIKYNHRVSVDIDLFSSGVVGIQKMNEILNKLRENFADHGIEASLQNRDSENLSFIRCGINHNNEYIKIEIIQNIKMLYQPEITHDGIRMIHDLDIASLKLLAAANRGEQKDFYDLYLLSEKHGLDKIYNALKERHKQFVPGADDNIFNLPVHRPKEDLTTDLSALGDFNKAGDKSVAGNRVEFIDGSGIIMPLPVLKQRWIPKVKALAKNLGLRFKETEKVIKYRRSRGLGM